MIKWEAENGRPFLVEGVALDVFVQKQWDTYEEQKVKEKEQRVNLLVCISSGHSPCTLWELL